MITDHKRSIVVAAQVGADSKSFDCYNIASFSFVFAKVFTLIN